MKKNLFKSKHSHDKDIKQNNQLVEHKEHKVKKIWNKILQFIYKYETKTNKTCKNVSYFLDFVI